VRRSQNLSFFLKHLLTIYLASTTDGASEFFGYMRVAAALVFSNLGSSYGTAKAGVGIASLGVIDSSKIFKGLIPIIMAGILGIYGLIVAIIAKSKVDGGSMANGYKILAAGLCCGLSSLASGLAIGVAGDAGVRAFA